MKNKRLNLLIGSIIGIIFLILWFNLIDIKEFASYFKTYNLWKTIPYLGYYFLAYFFRSLRWKEILKPLSKTTTWESYGVFNTGLLINYLIPIRLSEVAKSIILKMKKHIPMTIMDYYGDKDSDFPEKMMSHFWFEKKAPKLIKTFWAHHRYFLFIPEKRRRK